jgi:hypothetical protein
MSAHLSLRLPRPLIVILAAYLIAGTLYATIAPYLDVSDEPRHYAMIERLANGEGFVVQDPRNVGDPNDPRNPLQEGSQPPLYYLAMSVVARLFDRSDFEQITQFNPHAQLGRADATSNFNQMLHTAAENFPWRGTALAIMVMRFFGVLCGAVVVACTFFLAREVAEGDWLLAIGYSHGSPIANSQLTNLVPVLAASLTAFNPMFLHIMASVNNDTLATALASLALLLGARMIRLGMTPRRCLGLGLVLGCAGLAKVSGLALVIVVPLFVLLADWMRGRGAGELRGRGAKAIPAPLLLRSSALMVVPVLLIAAGWYVRNWQLYGELTGTVMMAQIAGPRLPPLRSYFDLVHEWDGFFKTYWGLFGAVNIAMSDWVYSLLMGLVILAGLGLILAIGYWLLKTWRAVNTQLPIANSQFLITLMMLSAFLVAFVALMRWTALTLASQGRLLFPVIAVISCFLAVGLMRVVPRVLRHALCVVVCVGLSVLAFAAPFAYIAPAYARPQLLQGEAQLPTDLHKVELVYEDKIRWLGYTVQQTRVRPGETLDITLYWQAQKALDKNYSLGLRLLEPDQLELLRLNTYPGGGLWQTTLWSPGEIIADHYRLRLPTVVTLTQSLPMAIQLDLDVGEFVSGTFTSITQTFDLQGQPSSRQFYEVASVGQMNDTTNATQATSHLDKAILLSATTRQDGREIFLRTTWLCTQDTNESYTMFVQLFDASNTQRQPQADGPVTNLPVKWWRKGDVIVDERRLVLSDDIQPGAYAIKFGLYKPTTFERMRAFDAKGQPLADDALVTKVIISGTLTP